MGRQDNINMSMANLESWPGDFLDVHCVDDPEEGEVLSAALQALCSSEKGRSQQVRTSVVTVIGIASR